jgi:hypothetical protein
MRMRRCTARVPCRATTAAALALALLAIGITTPGANGQPAKQPKDKPGVSINDAKAFQGYTLVAPMQSKKTYLIDMQGRVVKTWESDATPALTAFLLPNGNLLRPATLGGKDLFSGFGPGAGGRVQEFTWDGELAWDFKFANATQMQHHDITKLPNGNVLLVCWDKKTAAEAAAAGRKTSGSVMPDCLMEIRPNGKIGGDIVWEWHVWDHLIQDHDKAKANFGDVAAHPELIDANHGDGFNAMVKDPKDLDKLKGIGYIGGGKVNPDWTHINCVDYNAELDQIMLSVHNFSEIWIIDHSTSKAEAAGHTGGKSGKGGDLLYRWGNPRAYRAGTAKNQQLFAQHHAHWIPKGLPGAGHVLVFNNGLQRPGGQYSSVDELVLPVDEQGRYPLKAGTAWGPEKAAWSYTAPKKSDFYAMFISGADRLGNGNTLICDGPTGVVFEVTPELEVVWKFANPGSKGGFGPPGKGGFGPPGKGGPPRPGTVLPPPVQDSLKLTDEQKKDIDDFQKDIADKLEKLLNDDQKKQLKDGKGFGFGPPPAPGQVMPLTLQTRLKLSSDQKDQVADLQKAVDARLDKLFTDEQKKQFKQIQQDFARGGFGGFGPGGSSLFRSYRYAANYPGLKGRDLTPGKTLDELLAK